MTATKKSRGRPKKLKTTDQATKKKKMASTDKADTKKPDWSVITFEQIEEWRGNLGLSKSAMAEALQVTNSTYHNWRRGTTVPHPNQQNDILARLQALRSPETNEVDGHSTAVVGTGAFRRSANRGRGPLRPSPEPTNVSAQPHVGTPTGPQHVLPHADAIGRITAAFIASQTEPVSAGSVVAFIEQVRGALT